jgi:hypothetical protein
MQDGTPWPGNNTRDHPGMIQVKLNFFCPKLFDHNIYLSQHRMIIVVCTLNSKLWSFSGFPRSQWRP